jgi:hypothetical protein
MRVDAEERGIVAQFFAMLKDKSWSHASSADGTDVFKLPGERIHRIMGVTRTDATPEEVLTFFSDPRNFDEHFKILDAMFKSGSVVKIGGAGWTEAPEILSEESAEINARAKSKRAKSFARRELRRARRRRRRRRKPRAGFRLRYARQTARQRTRREDRGGFFESQKERKRGETKRHALRRRRRLRANVARRQSALGAVERDSRRVGANGAFFVVGP